MAKLLGVQLPFTGGKDVALAAKPAVAAGPIYDNPAITSEEMKVGLFDVKGSVGTVFFSGLLSQEEYNPDLAGDALLRMTDKMWRSDGEVAALIQVLILPLLEAVWRVQAASDSPEDAAIGQFVQDNLFGGMEETWHELLYFVLLEYLRDGFAVCEKVWVRSDDGKIRLRKLAPRLSKTLYRWYPGADDTLDRVQQRVWRTDPGGISGTYVYPVIPGDKLVVFTHQREGNNWQGVSVLRPSYKHWYMKDQLERLACVIAERLGAGIAVFSEPPGPVQKSDRDQAMAVLNALHAHEKMGVLEPNGWTLRLESAKGMDLLPLIQYHSLQIVRSVLAQFINLEKGGSYAMSLDVSTFFLQALHAKARYLRDVFNLHVIKPLVDLNFQVDRYPTLEVEDLDKRDIDKYLVGLGAVLSANWLTHNADTENALRSILGLPDLPPDATPAGGNVPTVDTDSAGKGAVPTPEAEIAQPTPAVAKSKASTTPGGVELPKAGEAPSEAQYAMREAIEIVLSDRPEGVSPTAWRDVVLAQSRAMQQEAVQA